MVKNRVYRYISYQQSYTKLNKRRRRSINNKLMIIHLIFFIYKRLCNVINVLLLDNYSDYMS